MALKSLENLRKKVAEKGTFDGESPFLTLKDGDTYGIRFLQELPGVGDDERRGSIVVVDEHTSPKDFKLRAVCTLEDDGHCWACEQTTVPEIGKKWKPRMRFYANVLVRTEKDGKTALAEPKVKILAQGFGDKAIGKLLIDYTDEYQLLGNQDMKIGRTGAEMNNTSYKLIPKAPTPMTPEEEALELKPLDKFVKYVPYAEQAAFYSGASDESTKDSTENW